MDFVEIVSFCVSILVAPAKLTTGVQNYISDDSIFRVFFGLSTSQYVYELAKQPSQSNAFFDLPLFDTLSVFYFKASFWKEGLGNDLWRRCNELQGARTEVNNRIDIAWCQIFQRRRQECYTPIVYHPRWEAVRYHGLSPFGQAVKAVTIFRIV